MPPHPRIRLGLGIVVITALALLAIQVFEYAFKALSPDVLDALRPIGVLAVLSATVGWWLFASRDPQIDDNRALRLWLRAAACVLLLTQTAAAISPQSRLIAAATWLPAAALFYLSLIHLRRIARCSGDQWLASRSLWCMIFAPVLVLLGIASMMAVVLTMTLEMSEQMAAINSGSSAAAPAASVPHLPSWALFLPLLPMASGTLWYIGVLTTAWIRFVRADRPPVRYAAA